MDLHLALPHRGAAPTRLPVVDLMRRRAAAPMADRAVEDLTEVAHITPLAGILAAVTITKEGLVR